MRTYRTRRSETTKPAWQKSSSGSRNYFFFLVVFFFATFLLPDFFLAGFLVSAFLASAPGGLIGSEPAYIVKPETGSPIGSIQSSPFSVVYCKPGMGNLKFFLLIYSIKYQIVLTGLQVGCWYQELKLGTG